MSEATSDTEQMPVQMRRSMSWSALNVIASRSSQFLVGIVVARIVSPNDFGVFAVALVVQAIVINVSELGVSAALVRDTANARFLAPTVSTLSIANSALLTLLMIVTAPFLSRVLGAEEAAGAVAVMSLTVLLAGVTAVPSALLWRDFRQDLRFRIDLASLIVSTAIVIPMALADQGAMALAWSRVGGSAASAVMFVWLVKERYRPGFDRQACRELLQFGLPLAAANIAIFLTLNIDYVVVGRMLGATWLGFYLLAFNIANWPTTIFGAVIKSVALPAFGRLRADPAALPKAFAQGLTGVVLITFPAGLLLSALAFPLVVAVYGDKWKLASSALIGLGVFAAARSVIELMTDFALALGRTRMMLAVQAVWLVSLGAAMWVGVELGGIGGAGAAHAAVAVLVVIPLLYLALRRDGLTLRPFLTSLLPGAGSALAAAGAGFAVASLISSPWPAVLAGGTVGLAVQVALRGRAMRELVTGLRAGRPAGTPTEVSV